MSLPWHPGWPPGQMIPDAVTVLEGTSFCLSDIVGDIDTTSRSRPAGLFVQDIRVLSRWRLRIHDRTGHALTPHPLSVHHSAPHAALIVAHLDCADGSRVLLERERRVGDGLVETLRLHNTTGRGTRVTVTLDIDADFASAQGVRNAAAPSGGGTLEHPGNGCVLRLSQGPERSVTVHADPRAPCEANDRSLSWTVKLGAHGTWVCDLQVVAHLDDVDLPPHHVPGAPPVEAAPAHGSRSRRRSVPRLATASPQLAGLMARSIEDLGTLRVYDPEHPRLPLVAAGAPWGMLPAARDTLFAAMMLLPVDPHLALGTLTILASRQGRQHNPETGEEPGLLPPLAAPSSADADPACGGHEATALFAVATGALHRWHPHLVSGELREAVDLAVHWLRADGETGGVQGPAERYGYIYAAYLAGAELAEVDGHTVSARQWREQADLTRAAFEEHYWLPDLGRYAAALDGDGRADTRLTAALGHCLWTGVVGEIRAPQLVATLLSPELDCGWGLRTCGTRDEGYDPLDLCRGAVWPHDTALAVAGLVDYGFHAEAARLASNLVDAATELGYRLPSALLGVDRSQVPVPLPHPASCAPAAAAAAAPLELLRALLRAEATPDGLECSPSVPPEYLPLALQGVHCRGAVYDVTVNDERSEVVRHEHPRRSPPVGVADPAPLPG